MAVTAAVGERTVTSSSSAPSCWICSLACFATADSDCSARAKSVCEQCDANTYPYSGAGAGAAVLLRS